jgi:hypothetical protein
MLTLITSTSVLGKGIDEIKEKYPKTVKIINQSLFPESLDSLIHFEEKERLTKLLFFLSAFFTGKKLSLRWDNDGFFIEELIGKKVTKYYGLPTDFGGEGEDLTISEIDSLFLFSADKYFSEIEKGDLLL